MKKILIVEDDVDLASNIKYMLSQSGYLVLVAHDGIEGIAMAIEKLPDLIIMDLMLPGKPGGEVVSTIKKNPSCKGIPIIFLTGLVSGKQESEGVEMINVDGEKYPALPKPFDFPQLLKTIENVL